MSRVQFIAIPECKCWCIAVEAPPSGPPCPSGSSLGLVALFFILFQVACSQMLAVACGKNT